MQGAGMLWESKGTLTSLERAVIFQLQPIATMGNGGLRGASYFYFPREVVYLGLETSYFSNDNSL